MDVSGGLERGRWWHILCPHALPSSPHLFHLHSVSSAAVLLSALDFTSRRYSEFCIGQTHIFYNARARDTAEECTASGKSNEAQCSLELIGLFRQLKNTL